MLTGRQVMDQEPDDETGPVLSPDPVVAVPWYHWNSQTIENVTRIAQRLVFAGAAIFAVIQYSDDRQEKREQEAFELVTLWESDEYQAAFTTVRQGLSTAIESAGQGDTNADVGLLSLSAAGEQAKDIRAAVDKLVYFGGRVGFCDLRETCDRATLNEYFGDALASLWHYYSAYISKKRAEESSKFGEYLELFLKRQGYDLQ